MQLKLIALNRHSLSSQEGPAKSMLYWHLRVTSQALRANQAEKRLNKLGIVIENK